MPKDMSAPHEILGIPRNASLAEGKKAYRRLSHKTYPRTGGTESAEFMRVNEAYKAFKALQQPTPSTTTTTTTKVRTPDGAAAYSKLYEKLRRISDIFNASALDPYDYKTLTEQAKANLRERYSGIRHIFTRRDLPKTPEMRMANRELFGVLDQIDDDRAVFYALRQHTVLQNVHHPDSIDYATIAGGLNKIESSLPPKIALAQNYFDILSGKEPEPSAP